MTCVHRVPYLVTARRVVFRWPGIAPVPGAGMLASARATSSSVNGPASSWRRKVAVWTPAGVWRLITRVRRSALSP